MGNPQIPNSRLISLGAGHVSFHWRDYRDGQSKILTISAVEFLRRFLQHVLPPRFGEDPALWLARLPLSQTKTGTAS